MRSSSRPILELDRSSLTRKHTLLRDTVRCIPCLILSGNVGMRWNAASYFSTCQHAFQNAGVASAELLVQRFMRPQSLRIRLLRQAVVFVGIICISGVFAASPLMNRAIVRLRWERVMEGLVAAWAAGLCCQGLFLLGLACRAACCRHHSRLAVWVKLLRN